MCHVKLLYYYETSYNEMSMRFRSRATARFCKTYKCVMNVRVDIQFANIRKNRDLCVCKCLLRTHISYTYYYLLHYSENASP